jgi:hypothetical protein
MQICQRRYEDMDMLNFSHIENIVCCVVGKSPKKLPILVEAISILKWLSD